MPSSDASRHSAHWANSGWIDRDFNIAWTLSSDGVLTLRHRTRAFLRDAEPSVQHVDALAASMQERQRFSLDEMAQLATLSVMQLKGTLAAVKEHFPATQHGAAGDFLCDIINIVNNNRATLRAYASLTTEQRRWETVGEAQLTPQQRELVLAGLSGSTSWEQSHSQQPFTWTVRQVTGDMDALLRQLGMPENEIGTYSASSSNRYSFNKSICNKEQAVRDIVHFAFHGAVEYDVVFDIPVYRPEQRW